MSSVDAADYDELERPLDAVCATHPERRASIVCPYCGSFACGDCTVDTLWGDVMCDACKQHGRARYPLPWEESLSPVAFVHTAYLVLADTGNVFGALPSGRVRRPLGFAVTVALLTGAASGLTRWLFAPRHWAERAPSLFDALAYSATRELVGSALFIAMVSAVFHFAARAFGGSARPGAALRSVCYLTAVDLVASAGAIADTIVSGNTFGILLGMVALFFVGWGLTALGEQRYGLTRGKAIAAGTSPIAVLILLGVALVTVSTMLAARLP